MARISTKIPKGYRYFFYLLVALCFTSGASFWLIREFFQIDGDFGLSPHFLQYPLLQIHGFMAFVMLMSVGAIFSAHIPSTWGTKRARKSGIMITCFISMSVITAYALYYLITEDSQFWLTYLHLVLGVCLPSLLIIHVKKARKSRRISVTNYS